MAKLNKIAILGVGLLGGSLARAIRNNNLADKITAWSRSLSTRQKCQDLKYFDEVCDSPQEAVAGADLVVLCTTTASMAGLAKQIKPHLKAGAIITDVGSVKESVCDDCFEILKDVAFFVGSHPMAGSEKIGVENSDEKLFDGKVCFVCDIEDYKKYYSDEVIKDILGIVQNFWENVGMRVKLISTRAHDEVLAYSSHLPHILASILCTTLESSTGADFADFVGTGFRDTTRVASGSVDMWTSIIQDNKVAIVQALKVYSDNLDKFIKCVEDDNISEVDAKLSKAKQIRDSIL